MVASAPTAVSTFVVDAPRSEAPARRWYTYEPDAVSQTVIVNRFPRTLEELRLAST
jgi:hypothetical protein